jgi:replicative DNA helicase
MNDAKETETLTAPSSLLFSEKLEVGVLTCILNNNNNFFAQNAALKADLFHNQKNKKLFLLIQKGISDGKTVDLMYVISETSKSTDKQAYAIDELMSNFTGYISDALFGQYVETLSELAKRRRMWLLGQKLIRLGVDMTYSVNEARKEVEATLEAEDEGISDVISMKEANERMMKKVHDNISGISDTFLPTGFAFLDDHCGFQTGDFNVIAAASSSGKTSLATKIAVNVAKSGKPGYVLFHGDDGGAACSTYQLSNSKCIVKPHPVQEVV